MRTTITVDQLQLTGLLLAVEDMRHSSKRLPAVTTKQAFQAQRAKYEQALSEYAAVVAGCANCLVASMGGV